MSDRFMGQIERSSFGTAAARAARRSVSTEKSQSLVARSINKGAGSGKSYRGREGK
jgi:hypothetical protein